MPMSGLLGAVELIGAGAGVFVGGVAQRATGIGLGLVVGPILVLVYGPYQGIVVTLILNLVGNISILITTWRGVQARQVAWLSLPALCVAPVAILVVRMLPRPAIMIVIGVTIIIAVLAAKGVRPPAWVGGTFGLLATGSLSSMMNVLAGVGGPPVTVYGVATSWPHNEFVASAQAYFVVLNLIAIGVRGVDAVPIRDVSVAIAILAAGVLVGNWLIRKVPAAGVQVGMLVIAGLGGMVTIIRGAAAV